MTDESPLMDAAREALVHQDPEQMASLMIEAVAATVGLQSQIRLLEHVISHGDGFESMISDLEASQATIRVLREDQDRHNTLRQGLFALLPKEHIITQGLPNELASAQGEWGVLEQVADLLGVKLPQPCKDLFADDDGRVKRCELAKGHPMHKGRGHGLKPVAE